MALNINDYLDYIQNNTIFNFRAKLEFLREDETVYNTFESDILSGTLNIKRQNGARRTVSLRLKNNEKKYLPNPNTFWINQKFKLSLGLKIGSEFFFINQGVFVLSNPNATSLGSNQEVNINGIDKFSLLDGNLGGTLDSNFNIPVGTNINTGIRNILILPTVNDPISPILSSTNILTPYTIYKDTGQTYSDLLLDMNGMLSRNMYYDVNGALRFQDDTNDSEKGSIYNFGTDINKFMYIDSNYKYGFNELKNVVIVIGDNINGEIFDARAENNDLTSPTSISKIGYKVAQPIRDNLINTTPLAQLRADYELRQVNILQSIITVKNVPVFHLDVDKVVSFTDDNYNIDRERFLIDSISIPLDGQNSMSVTVVDTSELGGA